MDAARLTETERLAAVTETYGSVPAVAVMLDFIREAGNRALALPRRREEAGDDDYSAGS